MKYHNITQLGQRKINEDYALSSTLNETSSIYLVVDGMGGYQHGDTAAKIVAQTIVDYISSIDFTTSPEESIEDAITAANTAISRESKRLNAKIGATIAGALIINDLAYLFWVGDAKAIIARDRRSYFESKDHSLLNELKSGASLPEGMDYGNIRHIVTRSIQGDRSKYTPDISVIKLLPSDNILLCSDGVFEAFSVNKLIKSIPVSNLSHITEQLSSTMDNATLSIIEI